MDSVWAAAPTTCDVWRVDVASREDSPRCANKSRIIMARNRSEVVLPDAALSVHMLNYFGYGTIIFARHFSVHVRSTCSIGCGCRRETAQSTPQRLSARRH